MFNHKKIKEIEKRLDQCDDFEVKLFEQVIDAKEAVRLLVAEVKRRDEIIEKLRDALEKRIEDRFDALNAKLHVISNRQDHAGCIVLPVAGIATLDANQKADKE